jgi:protein gp37
MAEQSGISWTDATFNPWIGCTKVGPGCDNCYAEALMDKRWKRVTWGTGRPRLATSERNWKLPLLWEKEHEAFALAHGRRRRVFCASLADVFDNEVPIEWRVNLFQLIADTPHIDWLVLTKRIGNAASMINEASRAVYKGAGEQTWPWDNVWIGATVVNQEEADRDIPKLLAVPARVRFLSIEPMLGPIDMQLPCSARCPNRTCFPLQGHLNERCVVDSEEGGIVVECICSRLNGLDWVIVGGESGAKARPFHVDWARAIVQQCQAAGVPVHVKQLGAQPRGWCAGMVHVEPEEREGWNCDFYEAHEQGGECPGRCAAMVDRAGGDPAEWPEDLRVQQWPELRGRR